MEFNHLCDKYGLDTISTGNVLGLAMDITEKGIHDFGLRFGDVEAYLKVPEQLAMRTGVGAELALGTRALARKLPDTPSWACRSRGSRLPATTRGARSA